MQKKVVVALIISSLLTLSCTEETDSFQLEQKRLFDSRYTEPFRNKLVNQDTGEPFLALGRQTYVNNKSQVVYLDDTIVRDINGNAVFLNSQGFAVTPTSNGSVRYVDYSFVFEYANGRAVSRTDKLKVVF